ncbi:MAG: hypothetical protein ABIQ31_12245 [Ferruginibacter sp.]
MDHFFTKYKKNWSFFKIGEPGSLLINLTTMGLLCPLGTILIAFMHNMGTTYGRQGIREGRPY